MDRSILARATEGTEAPTPGYLYLDIAKNAASSPVACSEIAQYLTSRLNNKNNANIKYKCLKVISKTAISPVTRGQFKRTLAQDSNAMAAIKEALQFRGPPDPARGDEPYQKVRTAAKEALDAIYSDAPTSVEHQPTQMQGIGSTATYARSTGFQTNPNSIHQPPPPSGTGRRMEGIGNPMYQNQRTTSATASSNTGFDIGTMTIGEIAKEATATLTNMIKDPLARNVELPPKYGNSTYGAPPGRHELAQSTGGQWTMASNRGPDSVGGSGYLGEPTHAGGGGGRFGVAGPAGGVGGSWGNVATVGSNRAPETTPQIGLVTSNVTGSGGIALTDGSFEKNMILELCPPGGVKAEPPPDKLARFAQAVPSLNADLICPALLDCLEEGNPWIIRAKALCVIETSITVAEQHTPDNNPYTAFFYACRGEIEPLTSHARSAIQQPAQRILDLMGISTGTAAAYPAAAAAPIYHEAPAADLLDFGADPVLPPIPSVAPPQAPPTPKTEGGLFGGLNLSDKAPPPTSSGSLFELNSISTTPASVAVASSLLEFSSMEAHKGGLFGDLMVRAVPTSAVKPRASEPNSDELFGDAIQTSAAVPAAVESLLQSDSNGLFGGMMINEAATTAATNTSTPSSAGGFLDDIVQNTVTATGDLSDLGAASNSAFGFINSNIAPPAAPTIPIFDPLLSLTAQPSPTTTKSMMANLGPEQLNAMYAQQNMLMMQQQMQQMQILMMQQQKMGGGQQQIGATSRLMQLPARGSNPNVMGSNANFAASSGFSFLDTPNPGEAKKKEDKSFDFVKDAMKNEKK